MYKAKTNEAHTKNSERNTKHIFTTYIFICSIWVTNTETEMSEQLTSRLYTFHLRTHTLAQIYIILFPNRFVSIPCIRTACQLWLISNRANVCRCVCSSVEQHSGFHFFFLFLSTPDSVIQTRNVFEKPTQTTSLRFAQAEKCFKPPFFIEN